MTNESMKTTQVNSSTVGGSPRRAGGVDAATDGAHNDDVAATNIKSENLNSKKAQEDETTRTTEKDQKTKSKKTVSFNTQVRCRFYLHVNNMSWEEKKRTWYQYHDYERMAMDLVLVSAVAAASSIASRRKAKKSSMLLKMVA